MYQEIIYEVDDPVATITLNRPDKLNAWTGTMANELRHALAAAENDKHVVGIIITGAGRAFCAGADMGNLQTISQAGKIEADANTPRIETADPGDPDFGESYRHAYSYISSIRKPVIAAINGPVAGMAVPIACFCDMRFGSEDAMFLTAFAKRGLIAEWGMSWLLPRLVGTAHTMDLLLSSRKVRADEAERMGLLNRVVRGEDLIEHTKNYIREMAAGCSPASLAIMKKQVYQSLMKELGESLEDANRLMAESFDRPDFKEGVSSFVESRRPAFNRVGKD
jgi:enoyl-CoA hydratase/carnithine racemase